MRRSVIALLAGALSFGAVQVASAADMPVKAPMAPVAVAYNWTGFYIGINGGGASGTGYWDYVPAAATNQNHTISGGLIGGTIGYNWQFPATNWVVGLEADWDWAKISGSASCPNPAFSCQTKTSSLGTFRGRVGYAMNNILFYGTGGLAWAQHQAQTVLLTGGAVPPSGTPTNGTTTNATGYTLGGGIEYGFMPHWSAKIEGLYVSFPSKTTLVDNGLAVSTHDQFGVFRAGINYRF
jgi:outer membrane immunogenic protein